MRKTTKTSSIKATPESIEPKNPKSLGYLLERADVKLLKWQEDYRHLFPNEKRKKIK